MNFNPNEIADADDVSVNSDMMRQYEHNYDTYFHEFRKKYTTITAPY